MLLRGKPASKIEDRLDVLTGVSTASAAKDSLLKEASMLSQPLDDAPGICRSDSSSGSAISNCCSSRPTRR